jgi:hypothetical protein
MLKDERIGKLREALRKSEEAKEYPKKYRRAELQGKLLSEFFNRLPECQRGEKLHIFSSYAGRYEFPQGGIYSYPQEEGVIAITLQHARFGQGAYACIYIYGQDVKGNRIKIRTYSRKENAFGVPLRDSPYFCPNKRWLFAVQAEGDAMEIVGALPNPGRIRIEVEKTEWDLDMDFIERAVRESEELDALYQKEKSKEWNEVDYEFLRDESLSLDDKIKLIENEKLKK